MLQDMYVQEVLARERREQAQRLYLRAQLEPPSRSHLFGFGRLGRRLLGRGAAASSPAPVGNLNGIALPSGAPTGAWPRLREVPPLRVPYVQPRRTIVEAARLLEEPGAAGLLLTKCGDRPGVVTRADVSRLMPSPATTLARHEIPALLARVTVAEAVRSPAPTAGPDEDVRKAVLLMREYDWQPLVVADGEWVYGVVTTGALLAALVRPIAVDDRGC